MTSDKQYAASMAPLATLGRRPAATLRGVDVDDDGRCGVFGPVSLAYLEDEAFAPDPAHLREYGFLKDSEFLDEGQARGQAFSVVFSPQGREFRVQLNDDESEILAMNELHGVGKRGRLGLREFTLWNRLGVRRRSSLRRSRCSRR
jgi:hypothetical protein